MAPLIFNDAAGRAISKTKVIAMLKPIVAFFKKFWTEPDGPAESHDDQPDQSRRTIMLAGAAAVVAGGLLVPALSTPAEAHSGHRRRRRRRRRRHRHYHRHGHRHFRRRRRRRYYGYGHRYYGYYYRRPYYYRPYGVQLYFGY